MVNNTGFNKWGSVSVAIDFSLAFQLITIRIMNLTKDYNDTELPEPTLAYLLSVLLIRILDLASLSRCQTCLLT